MTQPDEHPSAGVPPGNRRSRLLGGFSLKEEGAKGVLIATISTLVVLGILLYAATRSTYWPDFKDSFLNREVLADTFPSILAAFRRNIVYFLTAEPVILLFALLLAVLRSLRGPVFFPLRLLSTIYVDLFRGIPTVLVVYALGFGMPALQIPGLPVEGWFWGWFALILSYSAYVAEVYRAGIDSVHPSQAAASRALGLSRSQSLRTVVIPQAVRRVIPPLMNDFISLQKDTALIAFVSAFQAEAFLRAQRASAGSFNFTPFVGAAICFLVITIPMTRFTDWLLERQRKRRMAGGAT
ncbi:MAG TPA: amino acid ABC transporter permease [Actinomycetota bacterium]